MDIFKGDCFGENFVWKYMDIFEKIEEHFLVKFSREITMDIFEGN